MFKTFFLNKEWLYWAWGGMLLLIISTGVQTGFSVLLNDWYGRFYDILGNPKEHTVTEFYMSILYWVFLVIPYIFIVMGTNFFARHYVFRWRKAMSVNYWKRWRPVLKHIEGASQRIQEDTKEFGEIIESLGLQAVRAVMMLVAFLPVLWSLSVGINVPILSDISGSLVWLALVATLGGIAASWFVGYFLPDLEFNNQLAEAAYRKYLVLAEDDQALRFDLRQLVGLFTGIQVNYYRLYLHYGYFDLWVTFYSLGIGLLPDVIMGPNLFTGAITLGILMQVNNAFLKVWGSFSFIVDNWTRVTRVRSIWRRLGKFEQSLDEYNESCAA